MGIICLDVVDIEFFSNGLISKVHSRSLCESLCAHDLAFVFGVDTISLGNAKALTGGLKKDNFLNDGFAGMFIN